MSFNFCWAYVLWAEAHFRKFRGLTDTKSTGSLGSLLSIAIARTQYEGTWMPVGGT